MFDFSGEPDDILYEHGQLKCVVTCGTSFTWAVVGFVSEPLRSATE
jgi:hypothetical protein